MSVRSYLLKVLGLCLVLMEKMIPPCLDYDLIVNVCDVHDKRDFIAKIVLQHPSKDVNGHVVPTVNKSFSETVS